MIESRLALCSVERGVHVVKAGEDANSIAVIDLVWEENEPRGAPTSIQVNFVQVKVSAKERAELAQRRQIAGDAKKLPFLSLASFLPLASDRCALDPPLHAQHSQRTRSCAERPVSMFAALPIASACLPPRATDTRVCSRRCWSA